MHNNQGNGSASRLIEGARSGDTAAINELISIIYPELQRRAHWLMSHERKGHTFGASGSELVQRVLEILVEHGGNVFGCVGTEQDLINVLSRRMRYILVDYARAAAAQRRFAPHQRVQFDHAVRSSPSGRVNIDEVLSVDQILGRLESKDPVAAKALELRFFAGLTNEEGASAMGLNVATFRRKLHDATAFVKVVLSMRAAS